MREGLKGSSTWGRGKARRWALGLAVVLCLSPPVFAGEPPGKRSPPLQGRLDALLSDSCLRGAGVGVRILSLDGGEVLYDRRGEELFIPASNMKLLVAAAALHFLKPDYAFRTELYTEAPLQEGALQGHLYLKGFGDPSLVSEELWNLVASLRAQGLRKVRGDLVVDASYFEGSPSSSVSSKKIRAYLAPFGAASLNFNAAALYAEPGKAPGQPLRVVLEPDSSYFELINQARTTPAGQGQGLRLSRVALPNGDRIIVQGGLRQGGPRQRLWVSVSNPALYLGHTLARFLQKEGVSLEGRVRLGPAPLGARLLSAHHSKPLAQILRDLNKWSNNFMAEEVLRALGAEVQGPPGMVDKGVAAVRGYLKRLGIPAGSFQMVDGSGLSRENRLSPAQLVKILGDMYGDLRYREEFTSSLAVMGQDGTVRRRLRHTLAQQRVLAKTGSLDKVDTLSGYAVTREGEVLAFSILMNNSPCPHWKVKGVQDQITLTLVQLSRGFGPRAASPGAPGGGLLPPRRLPGR